LKSYQIRLPRFGLAAKLAAWLVAAALACFALFGYVYQRLEQRNLEALVTLSAERVSDIIYYSAWEAMQRNDRDMLYAMIRDIGREPGIQRLRIVNEEGWVRVSTDPHEVGTMVDKRAEACYACHAQSQPLTRLARKDRARVFVDEATGQRTLAVIRPIENSKECSNAACHAHPADRRILGVIDAHLSLETVDQRLAEMKWQTGWFSLAAAGLAGLLSIAFVWVFVHRPVRELARGTVQLAGGDLAHRIHISSKDELGSLGESFNLMAEELGQMHEELTQWNRTLEDRVRVKTAELETAHKGLIHNEKMASLGRLAATVAHEVNNPLFGMLTYARLTLKDLQRPDLDDATRARMTENLRVIERESRRCGDLMKNLLAFARQSPPQRAPVVVNQLIERAVQLVRHQFDLAQTRLELKLAEGLPEISCDPGQIQQVLIVLLVNAGEALGRGGEVVVRSAALQNGHGVAISVKDNGPGIPPELQTQVFEPFFSTKEDQHRTGLGLAVAKGIVERHGGTLALHSERGQGAEFVIELPLTTPGGPVREEPATSQAAQGASS
jgi:two-component system, NtrC family, sensor kinase